MTPDDLLSRAVMWHAQHWYVWGCLWSAGLVVWVCKPRRHF